MAEIAPELGLFENLSPGTYALMVTDDNGCTAATCFNPEYDPPRISKVEVGAQPVWNTKRCGAVRNQWRNRYVLYVLNGVEQPGLNLLPDGNSLCSMLKAAGAVDSVTVVKVAHLHSMPFSQR